jgi:hypothetical protein
MLTSFVLSMALAAPVPAAPATPVPSGPVPRLMEVKAVDGKIVVTVARTEMVQVGAGNAINPNGGPAPAVIKAQRSVTKTVELGEVKDLQITTADGKKIDTAEAAKRLKDGSVVVVSTDGKPVSPIHLKLFKDDVLVLASPELVPVGGSSTGRPLPIRPGGIRPLPAPVPGNVLPANPGGVIQIQIQPGQEQVIPLQPAPQPESAPAPAPEK